MERKLNAIFDYFDDEPLVVKRHSDAEFSITGQLVDEYGCLPTEGSGETLEAAIDQLYFKVSKVSHSN